MLLSYTEGICVSNVEASGLLSRLPSPSVVLFVIREGRSGMCAMGLLTLRAMSNVLKSQTSGWCRRSKCGQLGGG